MNLDLNFNFLKKIEKLYKNIYSFKDIETKMNFFEDDDELKREIEEEVQRLRLEERKKYVHSRALEILAEEQQEKNREMFKQKPQVDFYIQFIEETIVKTGNKEDKLFASDIFQHFDRWFKIHYPAMSRPSLAQMNADLQMSGRLGNKPTDKRCWVGYLLKI